MADRDLAAMHQRFCGTYAILRLNLPAHRQVLYFRSDWMEHPHFIIAFTGNEQTGKEVLFKKLTAQKGSAKPSRMRTCPALMVIFSITAAAIRQ